MNKIFFFYLSLITGLTNAQIFTQDFSSSTNLSTYISSSPNVGQFNEITTGGNNYTTGISNNALEFNRTGRATLYAYRNFLFTTNPRFVEFKFDFEASNNELNKNNVFAIFVGSGFSEQSSGSSSNFASRFGISTRGTEGEFRVSTIDNIGGAPSSGNFTGKQSITFIVNNTGEVQTYTAPTGNTENIAAGSIDLWIGTTRGIRNFPVKNTNSPTGDISGFKIQANASTGTGVFEFDNIQMTDLLNESVSQPKTQSLVHPHIWVSNSDKQKILENIETHDWASSLFNQLVERNAGRRNSHANNPAQEINLIPAIPGDRNEHRTRLNVAAECAILYYLTDDERYAQVAGDILHHYVKIISTREAKTFKMYTTNFNHLIQTREHFPRIGVIYDFIQPFLSKPGTMVFDKDTNTLIPFNFNTSQAAFEVISNNVLQVGGNNSNHPVLELPGALYNVLNMEDDAIRDAFFDKIMNQGANTAQPGVNWMLNRFSPIERLWPESAGYGKFTHAAFIQYMNVIDLYRPDLKIIENNIDLLESIFIYENFLYPNGATMAYGDIGRTFTNHAHIFRSILAIADRKGYSNLKERATRTLQKIYAAEGGYNPQITNQRLEYRNPLQLLWGVNVAPSITSQGEPSYSTITAQHAGVVMQRNYSGENNITNGLMYYTHGGTYVHTHAGGIDMEIYGAGYVIGPDYGADAFGSDIHEQYAVSPAAHNTVIANGTSGRGVSSSGTWDNITDEVVLEACEPKAYDKPLSKDFSFSTQFLDDNINNLDQQRTNSIIRTSPTTGYYVDIFRSKSNAINNFHDYLFHGLGDSMQIYNQDGSNLQLINTPERYQNDIGDVRKQPGWRWFSNAKTSTLTTNEINARFNIEFDNKYLHVNVPGGINKEYTSAMSPPTKEVRNGYSNKDTQMFVMRKYGEAWNEPFVAIYEPSSNLQSTVKSTTYIYQNDKVVGVKVVSRVEGQDIIDYVLANQANNETINLPELKASFTGRFAIIRTKLKSVDSNISLYIGEGQQLIFDDKLLTTDNAGKAFTEFTSNTVLSTLNVNKVNYNIKAYPNPTTGILEFSVPNSITSKIVLEVFNLHGQLVQSRKTKILNNKAKIDLSRLPSGAYFVKLNLKTPIYIKVLKS